LIEGNFSGPFLCGEDEGKVISDLFEYRMRLPRPDKSGLAKPKFNMYVRVRIHPDRLYPIFDGIKFPPIKRGGILIYQNDGLYQIFKVWVRIFLPAKSGGS